MKLLSISLARLTVITETAEINPRNQVSLPELTKAFVERYGFLRYPKTVEEYDLAKGVTFGLGKISNINIGSIVLFFGGVIIDTASSTNDSQIVLEDLIQWTQKLVGVEYSPAIPPKRYFLSELSFHSEAKLDALNPGLRPIANRLDVAVSGPACQQFTFEPIGITFMPDLQRTKVAPSAFKIERLANAPFEENKYFSSAPLPTDEHISVLEDFESILKQGLG